MAKILIDIPQETYDYIMNLYTVDIPRVETRGLQYTVINAIRQGKVIKEQPETSNVVKGFKAFNKNLKCRDMQYEIGKEYEMSGSPIICERGYHFCKNILDVYDYYRISEDTRVCEIEAYGKIVTNDNHKFCTNKIRIVKEIENPMEATNSGINNVGVGNSGNGNVGHINSGNNNIRNRNAGCYNVGYRNSGDCNSGSRNSGDYNYGDKNTSCFNVGSCNSGYCNVGNHNSGEYNSGDYNSGQFNSGDYNSGDWNIGNYNSGIFNTEENPTIRMFDADSDWTIEDWKDSKARELIYCNCPWTHSEFITEEDMSDEEKEKHSDYKITGGYLKVITITNAEKQAWWDSLSDASKQLIFDLPNFNAEKFKACTGIDVSKN